MNSKEESRPKKHVMIRIAACMLILLSGWAGMNGLASLKEPPAEAKTEERPIKVQVTTVQPGDYPVAITGYGEARALTVVTISPEVSGRVVYTHPSLKAGQIIPPGEVMFRIDPSDYQAGLQEARAGVDQWRTAVARLKKQLAIDTQRMKTLERSAQLAKTEFERIKGLFDADRVGTRSGVDQAERAYNSALDQADQISQAVSLYPLQIREAESSLASMRARLSVAETNLSRCTITAPFYARIQFAALEVGQFVSPGQTVLTLVDDTVLEIQVSLDSRDARRWLQFEPVSDRQPIAWFTALKPVECTIRWTEDKTGSAWTGILNRVVKFDQQTRTLTVAVRVNPQSAMGDRHRSLPLVEGMFCTVDIPGRTMRAVYRLPRQAVSFENKAYLVNADKRLKTVDVRVERIEGEHVYVGQGINAGDTVILTRLIDPLENALLDVAEATGGGGAAS
ncbi:efflux RND transporter periplasmic adaptor subunit [Desulfosarcina sp.]|uniref:efflux RND transporter periplasmic adaptor subunit n=1 Tax=Desulfosarcina sp. TaxID=2027861 RepID=UPI003970A50E